jgi:hypothetical protein
VVFGLLPALQHLVIHSNVFQHGAYGMKGVGAAEGTASINTYAPGALVTNNAIVGGGAATAYPASNFFPGPLANLGFVNVLGGNFQLGASSLYRGKGYDGRDIGADIVKVEAMTSNAVVAP